MLVAGEGEKKRTGPKLEQGPVEVRERELCSGRQVGENAVGVTSCKTLSVAVTFLEVWLLVGWLSITEWGFFRDFFFIS